MNSVSVQAVLIRMIPCGGEVLRYSFNSPTKCTDEQRKCDISRIIDGEWNPVRHRSSWPSTNRRKDSQRCYTSCWQRLTLWAVEWGGAQGFSLSRPHIPPVISFSVPGLPKPNSASSSRGALCWIPEFLFPDGRDSQMDNTDRIMSHFAGPVITSIISDLSSRQGAISEAWTYLCPAIRIDSYELQV